MVTFAQAQERADAWINADLPAYQHREVQVREFDLGFVVWAEDRAGGPVSDGGRQRWSSPATAATPPSGRACRSAR